MKKILIIFLAFTLIGLQSCASQYSSSENTEGMTTAERDPLERYNRAIYGFNEVLDKILLKPSMKAYRAITPDPVEKGFANFWTNLLQIRNVFNNILQGKFYEAGANLGRFMINSTMGLFGFIDVAESMEIGPYGPEDFGQTLAHWGVGEGPYIVWPIFGPSTFRDSPAIIVDGVLHPLNTEVSHVPTRNTAHVFRLVDLRRQIELAEELVEGDEYLFVRDAYLQRREYLIKDGQVEDDFGDGEDEGF